MLVLSDQTLIDTYEAAVQHELDKEFILLLEKEIERRGLNLSDSDKTTNVKKNLKKSEQRNFLELVKPTT